MSKHIKMAICDETCTASSSSDEDRLPMLPPTTSEDSDSEVSPIQDERSNSSSSKYVSSFLASSLSSISSVSEVSSYRNLHNGYRTPTGRPEFDALGTDSSDKTIGESSRARRMRSYGHSRKEMQVPYSLQKFSNRHGSHSKKQHKESKQVVQQREERREECSESTIVELIDEIPFELGMAYLRELDQNDQNGNNNPNNRPNIPGETLPGFLGLLAELMGLNKSKTCMFIMMNLSLIAANANQLKHILALSDRSTLFYVSIGLLIASTIFQIFAKIFSVVMWRGHEVDYGKRIKKMKCIQKFMAFFTVLVVLTNIALTLVTFAEFWKSLHIFDWIKWWDF